MTFRDIIKKSVLEGFQNSDISSTKIIITLGITFILACYIFLIYRFITRQVFYNKNFNISMAAISIVTAGIILSMQTNLVISLGMVGALSIVRFRTAIKEPMDLLFLFWSIGTGIICGAGTYELAIILSIFVTFGILLLQLVPVTKSPYLLIINSEDASSEKKIIEVVEKYTRKYRIDSKNLNQSGMDLIIETYLKDGLEIVDEIKQIQGVRNVSYLYHEGEVKS